MIPGAKWSPSILMELAEACHTLLREEPIDVARMAVPLLHFRSAHPNGLVVYETMLTAESPARRAMRDRVAGWRDRLGGHHPASKAYDEPERADVLFVSHFLSSRQVGQPECDLYFGDLPGAVAAAGYRCATALIDHTDGDDGLADWLPSAQTPRVLLRRRLSRQKEGKIARQLEQAAVRLENSTDYIRLRYLAARQARTGTARQSLRIAQQIGDLVHKLQPRALVLTYEGHAWERLVMRAARAACADVKCYAVHHAVLAPMQYAMQRSYGNDFDPDHLFTAGCVARDWLRDCTDLANIPIDVIGSPRATTSKNDAVTGGEGKVCLFLPEGLAEESLRLARAARAVAVARQEITCVVRLHPLMTKERLQAMEPELGCGPENLHWSPLGRALAEDTADARWAVYRGSSAILAATADGVEPIYLGDEPAELTIDPLRTRSGFGQIARSVESLISLLHAGPYDRDAQSAGQTYAKQYYTPLDPDMLLRALAPSS